MRMITHECKENFEDKDKIHYSKYYIENFEEKIKFPIFNFVIPKNYDPYNLYLDIA